MEFPTQELRELLNLDADATAADVVARVRELRNRRAMRQRPATGAHAQRSRALRRDRRVRARAHRAQRAQGRARARARRAHGRRGDSRRQNRAGAARVGGRILRRGRARFPGLRRQAAVDSRRKPGPGAESRATERRAGARSTRRNSRSARNSASSIRSLSGASADAPIS